MSPSSSPIIRASEIGQWAYCQRAWWLARQGYAGDNVEALEAGTAAHARHARGLASAERSGNLALALLALGMILSIAAFLMLIVS